MGPLRNTHKCPVNMQKPLATPPHGQQTGSTGFSIPQQGQSLVNSLVCCRGLQGTWFPSTEKCSLVTEWRYIERYDLKYSCKKKKRLHFGDANSELKKDLCHEERRQKDGAMHGAWLCPECCFTLLRQ